MYPNPSQPQHTSSGEAGGNHQQHQLTRYGSAPSSVFDSSDVFLRAGIDSSQSNGVERYSRGSFGVPTSGGGGGVSSNHCNLTKSIARSGGASSSNSLQGSLVRHSSSPPGFLHHLATCDTELKDCLGFTLTNGGQSYSNSQATSSHGVQKQSRLGSEFKFANQVDDHASLKRAPSSHSTPNGFSISSWEEGESLVFGASSSKRGKNVSDDLLSSLSAIDSHLSEMGVIENMLHIPEDSVACKVRAKRGFATHPRSIAERERRTRISGKLKKLQELVPNMDKQTSYSEMLDLAIQHITGLQFQIQKLNKEVNSCTCGCKPRK